MEQNLIIEHLNDKYLNLLTIFDVGNLNLRTLLENRSYIAGGAIRSLLFDEPNGPEDYDIFFYDQESLNRFLNEFRPAWRSIPIALSCSESTTAFSIILEDNTKYQIIKTFSDLPENTINRFDFTCNMGFYLPSNQYLHISPRMLMDSRTINNKKSLIFNRNCVEFISLSRILEFYNKGYEMSDQEFYEMCRLLGQPGRVSRRMYTNNDPNAILNLVEGITGTITANNETLTFSNATITDNNNTVWGFANGSTVSVPLQESTTVGQVPHTPPTLGELVADRDLSIGEPVILRQRDWNLSEFVENSRIYRLPESEL